VRTGKLTTAKLAKVRTEIGRHGDGANLYLQVTSPTSASWLLRYQIGDRERWLGLGSLSTLNAVEARERARKARLMLLDGQDPIDARRAAKAAAAFEAAKTLTFEASARQYFDQHSVKWSSAKHRNQFITSLATYAFPIIGKLSVADITTGLVLKVIEPHWATKTSTMDRVRNRIEQVLSFAKVRGARTGDNPAVWANHLSNILPAKSQIARVVGHAAMAHAELPSFWIELEKRQGMAAQALKYLILTASRSGEVRFMTWQEVELDAKLWVIPPSRMKARREHRVPLSDQAVALLAALPREGEYVFPGSRKNKPINLVGMAHILKKMGRTDITVHGFRSSFSTWANERSYPQPAIEMSLAHAVGGAVERAYRRTDLLSQRAKLMADWGRFCTEPTRDATVIRLNR
jgi:integrase